jgi:betaine lipid synthase
LSVPENFSEVYLVDLSPSLCNVARKRFEKLGFQNVHVVCTDARSFHLESVEAEVERKADWISMSYSLSMIPEYAHFHP